MAQGHALRCVLWHPYVSKTRSDRLSRAYARGRNRCFPLQSRFAPCLFIRGGTTRGANRARLPYRSPAPVGLRVIRAPSSRSCPPVRRLLVGALGPTGADSLGIALARPLRVSRLVACVALAITLRRFESAAACFPVVRLGFIPVLSFAHG